MIADEIALGLLSTGAVKLRPEQPFKWASGWNSPIYCDNRLTLSFPEIRSGIKKALIETVKKEFSSVEAIAGVATAGIPQGALIADALNIPFLYVRPKPKDHGMENLIEGKVTPGQKVVVVEDLISTGGSSLKAVEALKDNKFEVLGMVGIFSYGFPVAQENFDKAKVRLVVLSNYEALLNTAVNNNYIDKKDLETLKVWRENPGGWMQ